MSDEREVLLDAFLDRFANDEPPSVSAASRDCAKSCGSTDEGSASRSVRARSTSSCAVSFTRDSSPPGIWVRSIHGRIEDVEVVLEPP
jgi:hypothetical protein